MSKPWLFTSERQPTRRNPAPERNLAASHHRARERVQRRRQALVTRLQGMSPMTARELWHHLSGEWLRSGRAADKLAGAWGFLKEEGRRGRVAALYQALGWPAPLRGRPSEGVRSYVPARERWLAERRAGC